MRLFSLYLLALFLTFSASAGDAEIPACAEGVPVVLARPAAVNDDAEDDRAELSGVILEDNLLLTISNEALNKKGREFSVQVFEGSPDGGYQFVRDVLLYKAPKEACKQADFEGLAWNGDELFAITSHSADCSKQEPGNTYEANTQNLSRAGITTECNARDQLLKFRIGDADAVEQLAAASLRDLISGHPVLGPFSVIPNKENGVDIEGLAAMDGDLFVGFRGPVLRQNYVPVLRLHQDLSQKDSQILFVNLGGRGIRDIAPGPDGLYILAGPNGDEPQSFAIYRWDGKDQVGGTDHQASKADLRCDLGFHGTDPQKSKPEGIAYVDTTSEGMRFLLVYDGKAPLKAELRTVK